MPKLLSTSKHEEFESNSALQIKDQKERRAKCEEKWSTTGVLFPLPLCILRALFLQRPVLMHFTPQFFCYIFLFLPILTLVIAFVLVFFLVISYTLSTYISLSLYKLKSIRQ